MASRIGSSIWCPATFFASVTVAAAVALMAMGCFPELPPEEVVDSSTDLATLQPEVVVDVTPVDDIAETLADFDGVPDDLTPDDAATSNDALADDITQETVAFENLPATAKVPWGRSGSYQVDVANHLPVGFNVSATTCPFTVSVTSDGTVSWACPQRIALCDATIEGSSGESTTHAVLTIACVNTPPTVLAATVIPDGPIPGDALTCVIDGFEDVEGDPQLSRVVWFKNQTPLSTDVSAVASDVGDDWTCEVTPYDGLETGMAVLSSPVTVKSRFVGLAVGSEHACAVHRRGHVSCWGANSNGQLGDLSTTPSSEPVVVAIIDDAVAVTAGGAHTCALRSDRSAMCWGANTLGQAGNPESFDDRLFPVSVSSLGAGVEKIVAGTNHVCALQDGSVWCWGSNQRGQLGRDLSVTLSRVPAQVMGLPENITDVDTSGDLTCALGSGETWCWGQTEVAQPYADFSSQSAPYRLLREFPFRVGSFPPTVTTLLVTNGWRICGRTPEAIVCDQSGGVSTNLFGHVADPSLFRAGSSEFGAGFRRIDLPDAESVIEADAGDAICARWTNGTVRCFGNDGQALLGSTNRTLQSHWAEAAPLAAPATAIATGARQTCSIAGNDIKCWGRTRYRAAEDDALRNRGPVTVANLNSPALLSLGHHHACAITTNDELSCWGRNDYNQLADYSNSSFASPSFVVDGVSSVSAYGDSTLVYRQSALVPFGGAFDDYTGFPSPEYAPSNGEPVSFDAAWSSYFLPQDTAQFTAPYAYCGVSYDHNGSPRLTSNCPIPLGPGIESDLSLYACQLGGDACWVGRFNENSVCIMDAYSELFCGYQQVGFPDVGYGTGTFVASARGIGCIVAGGGLHCFGRNDSGQLGRGTTSAQSQPAGRATALTGTVTHASLSDDYGCAVIDSDVYCWGRNKGGRLGHADIVVSQTIIPRKVEGLAGPATRVVTSQPDGTFSCAVLEDGRTQCWGDNIWGQLGNGQAAYQREPQRVPFPTSP